MLGWAVTAFGVAGEKVVLGRIAKGGGEGKVPVTLPLARFFSTYRVD